jgi:endonuclease YncB( thermonuclease family)
MGNGLSPSLHVRTARFTGARRLLAFLLLAVVIAAAGRLVESFRAQGRVSDPAAQQRADTKPLAPPRVSADPARPRVVSGLRAVVVDGDSLRIGHDDIRIEGIDAPELRQSCRNSDGREWPCGRAARARLTELLSGAEIICRQTGKDRYGRTLAVCAAGSVRDIGEAMVLAGLAVNYDRYGDRYLAAQTQARAVRRGIWSGPFETPENWRAAQRQRESVGWSGRDPSRTTR